jgi:aminoglycoside phosphotransferase (APT) family kinase protein
MACFAQGRTGLLIDVSDYRVAKVYPPRLAHRAGREFAALRVASDAGLPVPAPLRIKRVQGVVALVMERVPGPTMYQHFLPRPLGGLRLLAALRRVAWTHAAINAVPAPGLDGQRDAIERAVRAADLDSATRAAALASLDGPCPRRLCHGDMHISNVIWSAGGPVVVDWENAGGGWPDYDAARAVILLLFGGAGHHAGRALAAEAYLHWYCRWSGVRREDVRRWLPTAAAARLGAGLGIARRAELAAYAAGAADAMRQKTKGAKSMTPRPAFWLE